MLKRGSCLKELWQYQCDGSVISIATTPNCSLISAATVGRSIYLFNSEGGLVWEKRGINQESGLDHEGWSTAISPDGSIVAVGTANKNPSDGTLYVFNSRGEQAYVHTLDSPIWSIALSQDGGVLAAACWNGNAYKFNRQRAGYALVGTYKSEKPRGLYGIKLNRDGTRAFVCAYDYGILVLDEEWNRIGEYKCPNGLYNIAIAEDAGVVVAGLRDGGLLRFNTDAASTESVRIDGCARPICGVATSRRAELAICGSFDGWAYLVLPDGSVVSRFETSGEVWSVACSDDAALIAVASGDHTVRLLENACSASPIKEVLNFEAAVKKSGTELDIALTRLVKIYAQYGLFEYGHTRLHRLQNQSAEPTAFSKPCEDLLRMAVTVGGANHWAHYELGVLGQAQKRHREAITHFQKSAQHPDYTSRSMTRCADSFAAKQLPNATASCNRRAREQQIDSESKRVLYNLARSYEDTLQWRQAISHLQLLASWDVDYRNTWERLEHLISIHGTSHKEETGPRADYTGITISLLGPDAPREVDDQLNEVLQARTAEVLIKPGEREQIDGIIAKLRGNERFSRGITGVGLEYDKELFLKYDFALPEDETKKFLETVNLLYLLAGRAPKETLDVGSASGRYPMLMKWLGAEAWGVDIEAKAVKYAEEQREEKSVWPKYMVQDARSLQFARDKFDLVTCMMGTFAHIQSADQKGVVEKMFSVLAPEGQIAISTWDLECGHLAYLSIYNEKQKDMIRKTSPSAANMKTMLSSVGFEGIEIRPFCMLPQTVVYDLGIENLRSGDIQLVAQADLAVRALYPDKHGEMFLAFARKPKL